MERGMRNELGTSFFIRKRNISAFKRVEFVSDRMLHIILRGCWCDIIVLNIHALTEDKFDNMVSFCKELEHVYDNFHKFHMKILLGDYSAKVGGEDIFKPSIANESLHEISNDDGIRVVNFATYKNLIVKSTMFQHRNIHKFTWISPDGKTHDRIDHNFIDR
jgi:hypothetical protein